MVPVRPESGLVHRSLADSPPDSAGLWRTLAGLRGPVKIIAFQLMILRGRRMRSSKLDCRYSYRFLSVRIARNLDRSCSGGTEGPCSCLANETVLGNGRLGVRLPNRRLQLGNWYTVIVLSVSTGSSAYSYQSLGQIFVSKMTWPFHCSEDLNKLKLPYM